MNIEAVVFDMDGVLIDSEPLWRKAEITVFHQLGIPITEQDCIRLMGLRTDEVVNQLLIDYQSDLVSDSIVSDILDEVCRLIREEGKAVPAIQNLVKELAALEVPLAVATSSPLVVVNEVLTKTDLDSVFKAVVSAQFFSHGKPHPMVYLEACSKLGLHPGNCFAVEDSINGVLAAKAARMKVVAMPAKADLERKEFGIADFIASRPEDVRSILLPFFCFA